MHDHYFKTIIHQKTRGIGIKLLVGEKLGSVSESVNKNLR